MGVVFVLLRAAGKIAGGMAAATVTGVPRGFGLSLLAPGIIGIAYAVCVFHFVGQPALPLLTIVALGAMGSELAAFVITPRGDR